MLQEEENQEVFGPERKMQGSVWDSFNHQLEGAVEALRWWSDALEEFYIKLHAEHKTQFEEPK